MAIDQKELQDEFCFNLEEPLVRKGFNVIPCHFISFKTRTEARLPILNCKGVLAAHVLYIYRLKYRMNTYIINVEIQWEFSVCEYEHIY